MAFVKRGKQVLAPHGQHDSSAMQQKQAGLLCCSWAYSSSSPTNVISGTAYCCLTANRLASGLQATNLKLAAVGAFASVGDNVQT